MELSFQSVKSSMQSGALFGCIRSEKLNRFNFYLLFGLAATLLFDQDRYKLLNYLVEITTIILVARLCFDRSNKRLRTQIASGMTVIGIILVNQWLSDESSWPKGEVKDLIFMCCMMAAVAIQPVPMSDKHKIQAQNLCLLLLLTACLGYLVYIYCLSSRFAIFHNPHFLSLQVVILVNMGIFLSLKFTGIKRLLSLAAMVTAIFILTTIISRIAWVAIGVSLLIWLVLIFQHIKHIALYAMLAIMAGLFATTQVQYTNGPVEKMATESNAYLVEIWHDERVILWTDSWQMQRASNLKEWLVGHGMGGFEKDFSDYSSYSAQRKLRNTVEFEFPHNFILEVLYNSGVIGLLALLVPLGLILFGVIKNTQGRNYHAILALALFFGVFTHTFFTLPLFTRFPSMTLGLILGYCLWLNRNAKYHAR